MTTYESPPQSSSSPSRQITVLDVYDLATAIKFDLEKIVDQFGQQTVQELAMKVVSALETLEALAKHNEKENDELLDLHKTVEKLEADRQMRMLDKENMEKDMIEIEESFKKEIDDLWAMVRTLKSEKEGLQSKLKNIAQDTVEQREKEVIHDEEFQLLINLKRITSEQKDKIKDLQAQLKNAETDGERLKSNVERLIQQNYELVRKNKSIQSQCKALIQERHEVSKKSEAIEEENVQLRKTLQDTSRACRDLEQRQRKPEDSDSPRFSINELREVLQEKTNLKQKVIQLQEELDGLKLSNPATTSETPTVEIINADSTSSSRTSLCDSNAEADETNDTTASDEVVYGPINKEPEEKLYPWKYHRKQSGIRKMPTTELGTPRLANTRVLHSSASKRSVSSRTSNLNQSIKSDSEFSMSRSFALDSTTSENIDERAKKYLDALDEYCSALIRDRRNDFVDLVGFDEKQHYVTLEDLEDAKCRAEHVTKLEDHSGMSVVELNRAIEAGMLAFAALNRLTRQQIRDLAKELGNYGHFLLDEAKATKQNEIKRIRDERDNFIIEAYVDLKHVIRSKYEILRRVEEVVALDKIQELPDPKRLRGTSNSNKLPAIVNQRLKRSLDSAASYRTPPATKQRKINPLDFDKIMDDFRDEQARDFVYINQRSRRRTLGALRLDY